MYNYTPPPISSITIPTELLQELCAFIANNPDRRDVIQSKVFQALRDIIDQEIYEKGVRDYWKARRP